MVAGRQLRKAREAPALVGLAVEGALVQAPQVRGAHSALVAPAWQLLGDAVTVALVGRLAVWILLVAAVTRIAPQLQIAPWQLAVGFTLTVVTIWLVPILRDSIGWEWTFAFLAPGPAIGIVAMLYLQRLPESRLIAGGRG